MIATRKADPGIGRDSAPVGSKEWAERVRLNMQGLVSSVHSKPEGLKFYVDLVKEHHAWTLMNKDDGTYFRTFEEFCEYRQPWGLGRPWDELKLYVLAVCSGNSAKMHALTTSAEAAPTLSEAGKKGGKTGGRGRERKAPGDIQGPNHPGTTNTYLAARIARDAPEVHERMKRGEFKSVRQAAIEAGIQKPADPAKGIARAIESFPLEQGARLVRLFSPERRRWLLTCLKDCS